MSMDTFVGIVFWVGCGYGIYCLFRNGWKVGLLRIAIGALAIGGIVWLVRSNTFTDVLVYSLLALFLMFILGSAAYEMDKVKAAAYLAKKYDEEDKS